MHWLRAILTVEEELSGLSDVREVLRESTNWAVWAASFGTADELMETFTFDLLVVQVSSDDAHGITLIEQRRASHPQTPIIAIIDSASLESLIRLSGAIPVQRPLVAELNAAANGVLAGVTKASITASAPVPARW